MTFLTQLKAKYKITAEKTPQSASKECIEYILEHESEDYYDQIAEHFSSFEEFEKGWKDMPHIYVSALIASGHKPDFEFFRQKFQE